MDRHHWMVWLNCYWSCHSSEWPHQMKHGCLSTASCTLRPSRDMNELMDGWITEHVTSQNNVHLVITRNVGSENLPPGTEISIFSMDFSHTLDRTSGVWNMSKVTTAICSWATGLHVCANNELKWQKTLCSNKSFTWSVKFHYGKQSACTGVSSGDRGVIPGAGKFEFCVIVTFATSCLQHIHNAVCTTAQLLSGLHSSRRARGHVSNITSPRQSFCSESAHSAAMVTEFVKLCSILTN